MPTPRSLPRARRAGLLAIVPILALSGCLFPPEPEPGGPLPLAVDADPLSAPGCEQSSCTWVVAVTVENETDIDTTEAPQFGFPGGTAGTVLDIGDCGVPLDAAGTGDSECQATIELEIPFGMTRVIEVDAGSHVGSDTVAGEAPAGAA
jgi:hypothetical protein